MVQETARDTRSARQVGRKAIPLEKAHIHNTAKSANTDFLASDITPSDPVVLFRIMVQLDTAAESAAKNCVTFQKIVLQGYIHRQQTEKRFAAISMATFRNPSYVRVPGQLP